MKNKAAQALARLARDVPKNYSPAEIKRRKDRLAEARKKRWPKSARAARTNHKGPACK